MIFLILNLLWLVPLAVVIAILRVSKLEIPPVFNCPKCSRRAKFIRDRGFEDGSGLVFTCKNEWCSNHHLYFYFPKTERKGLAAATRIRPFRKECTPELARRLRRQIAERLRKL